MKRRLRAFLRGDSPPDRVRTEGEHQGLESFKNKGPGHLLEEKHQQTRCLAAFTYWIFPQTS